MSFSSYFLHLARTKESQSYVVKWFTYPDYHVRALWGGGSLQLASESSLPSLCILLLWTLPYMWCRGQAQSREDRELFRIKGEFLTGSAGAAFFLLLAHSPWGGNGLVTGLEAILLVCSLGAAFVYGIYFIKKKISESISRIIR